MISLTYWWGFDERKSGLNLHRGKKKSWALWRDIALDLRTIQTMNNKVLHVDLYSAPLWKDLQLYLDKDQLSTNSSSLSVICKLLFPYPLCCNHAHAIALGQFANPSWCFDVGTTYLAPEATIRSAQNYYIRKELIQVKQVVVREMNLRIPELGLKHWRKFLHERSLSVKRQAEWINESKPDIQSLDPSLQRGNHTSDRFHSRGDTNTIQHIGQQEPKQEQSTRPSE